LAPWLSDLSNPCKSVAAKRLSKAPRRSGMTALAGSKVVTPKRALAIMTSHATLATTGRMVMQWLRRCDLSSLRHSRSYLMTLIATYFLML
jgi:hypothetical protein